MKILYRQKDHRHMHISNCYLKHIFVERDSKITTKKVHHHTDFEIHILEQGCQIYEMENQEYPISTGDFLIIPPNIKHRLAYSAPNTLKYSITFHGNTEMPLFPFAESTYSLTGPLPPSIQENLRFITEEHKLNRVTSSILIENRVLESIVLLFRAAGIREHPAEKAITSADLRVTIAKQYIADNAELNLSVSDIAKYCYLSPKQLCRLFSKYEDISLSAYIHKQRIERVAALLRDESLSLKDISERMHFNNEYYFNTFVKKNLGQPPGAYRKMHK